MYAYSFGTFSEFNLILLVYSSLVKKIRLAFLEYAERTPEDLKGQYYEKVEWGIIYWLKKNKSQTLFFDYLTKIFSMRI